MSMRRNHVASTLIRRHFTYCTRWEYNIYFFEPRLIIGNLYGKGVGGREVALWVWGTDSDMYFLIMFSGDVDCRISQVSQSHNYYRLIRSKIIFQNLKPKCFN